MSTVSLIHAAILVLQVAAGVCYSDAPLLWLQSYATLSICLCGGLMCLAALSSALFPLLGARLQPAAPRSRVFAEALESCRAMVVFSGFAAWPRTLLLQGKPTALLFSLAAAQPEAPRSVALYCAKLAAITLGVDAYMYFKHLLLHTRPFFAFHSQHHGFPNPTPFAAFAVAPVEAALTFAPVLALCLPAAPVWAHAYAAWTAGFVALNLYLHSGVEVAALEWLLRRLALNSSAFHNVHHESGGSSNYGELSFLWDRILGTGAHPPAKLRKNM
jgi:sterol desaturase/sphingolipid hydroxylase (fatty acid hydroxylase superfamily)